MTIPFVTWRVLDTYRLLTVQATARNETNATVTSNNYKLTVLIVFIIPLHICLCALKALPRTLANVSAAILLVVVEATAHAFQ